LKSLAKYLEVDLTESQLKMLLTFVSFDNMKNYPSFDFRGTKGIDYYFDKNIEFFKKGQIANWKNFFSSEMSWQVDEMVNEKLSYERPIKFEPSVEIN
jgi:tRNA(His) 5'-end guanylyltransferase